MVEKYLNKNRASLYFRVGLSVEQVLLVTTLNIDWYNWYWQVIIVLYLVWGVSVNTPIHLLLVYITSQTTDVIILETEGLRIVPRIESCLNEIKIQCTFLRYFGSDSDICHSLLFISPILIPHLVVFTWFVWCPACLCNSTLHWIVKIWRVYIYKFPEWLFYRCVTP